MWMCWFCVFVSRIPFYYMSLIYFITFKIKIANNVWRYFIFMLFLLLKSSVFERWRVPMPCSRARFLLTTSFYALSRSLIALQNFSAKRQPFATMSFVFLPFEYPPQPFAPLKICLFVHLYVYNRVYLIILSFSFSFLLTAIFPSYLWTHDGPLYDFGRCCCCCCCCYCWFYCLCLVVDCYFGMNLWTWITWL